MHSCLWGNFVQCHEISVKKSFTILFSTTLSVHGFFKGRRINTHDIKMAPFLFNKNFLPKIFSFSWIYNTRQCINVSKYIYTDICVNFCSFDDPKFLLEMTVCT